MRPMAALHMAGRKKILPQSLWVVGLDLDTGKWELVHEDHKNTIAVVGKAMELRSDVFLDIL